MIRTWSLESAFIRACSMATAAVQGVLDVFTAVEQVTRPLTHDDDPPLDGAEQLAEREAEIDAWEPDLHPDFYTWEHAASLAKQGRWCLEHFTGIASCAHKHRHSDSPADAAATVAGDGPTPVDHSPDPGVGHLDQQRPTSALLTDAAIVLEFMEQVPKGWNFTDLGLAHELRARAADFKAIEDDDSGGVLSW